MPSTRRARDRPTPRGAGASGESHPPKFRRTPDDHVIAEHSSEYVDGLTVLEEVGPFADDAPAVRDARAKDYIVAVDAIGHDFTNARACLSTFARDDKCEVLTVAMDDRVDREANHGHLRRLVELHGE